MNFRARRKSQVFSLDFIFSTLILVMILSVLGTTWFNLQNSIFRQEEQKLAVESGSVALDFLTSSPGYPENWDNSTGVSFDGVSNLGLKGSIGISLKKLLAFENLSALDYLQTKNNLGLGAYQFRLFVTENITNATPALSGVARPPIAYFASDSRDFFSVINASGVAWDYYWGQGSLSEPSDWGTARYHYSSSKQASFNGMLSNQSLYKTIVVEAPAMQASLVNSTLLNKFFDEGGTLVYIAGNAESELAITGFGAAFRKSLQPVPGEIVDRGFFLRSVSAGQNYSSNGQWVAFSPNGGNAVRNFAVNSTNSSEGLVSTWNYSRGRIYFVSDFNAQMTTQPAKSVLNIVGWPIDYGIPPIPSAQFVFPSARFTFIEGDVRIPAAINLVVWSD